MTKIAQAYGIGQALIPVLPPPLPFQNAPTVNQTNYDIGQIVYTPPNAATAIYMYAGAGNWIQIANGSGDILAINGTAAQITATTVSGTTTLSLPDPVTPPGNIKFTNAANGVVWNAGTATGTTSATFNSRAGNIVITAPSIAAINGTFTFTISNSTITGSTTKILYSVSGGTQNAGISIFSIANTAGQSVVVLQNSSATIASTADVILTFLVLT